MFQFPFGPFYSAQYGINAWFRQNNAARLFVSFFAKQKRGEIEKPRAQAWKQFF
jgi:hypothetical protein